ncbi:MAG: HK97 family phage prohead protease [Bacillota bacterium]|nr:HK97 family phage prohead protease [Bacillota bacterium]
MNGKPTVIDLAEFKQKALAQEDVQGLVIRKQFVLDEIKQVEGEQQTLLFVISTGIVDRDQDTINPDGWKLDNYLKNPVVLWAHDYASPPVARALATWVENQKLMSKAEFTPRDLYPFGHMVYEMYANGFLRATSVGFNPVKWQFSEDRKYGVDFLEQELLEYSCVPVPANPEALIAASAKGIDLAPLKEWAEKILDGVYGEAGLWVPKSQVERVFKLAGGGGRVVSLPAAASAEPHAVEEKGVITYAQAHPDGCPMAPEDEEWDAAAEVAAADVEDLKAMCAWFAGDGENKNDYKLPHHKAAGKHAVVWRGVAAAGAALMGARGGVDIPEDDVAGVKTHLARHYEEFGKTPPWEGEEGRAFEAISRLELPPAMKEDIGRVLLAGLFGGQKAGRVLSAANEQRLAQARDLIQEVLDQLNTEEPEPAEQEVAGSVSQKTSQPEGGSQIIDLDAIEPASKPETNQVDVDPQILKEIIRETVAEELRAVTGRVD